MPLPAYYGESCDEYPYGTTSRDPDLVQRHYPVEHGPDCHGHWAWIDEWNRCHFRSLSFRPNLHMYGYLKVKEEYL